MPDPITMPDVLLCYAPAEITAAAGDQKSPPKVSILAYTGGVIKVAGWGAVAFDLSGLDTSGQVVLLADHNSTLGSVAGRGEARIISGRELCIEGTLSTSTDAGLQVLALTREGQKLQASVGVNPISTRFIKPGDSVAVNGRTLTADGSGFTLIEKGRLREVSILPLAADENTSVQVAAKRRTTEEEVMPETTVVTTPAEQIRAEAAAETDRISAIRAACGGKHSDIEAQAIRENWNADKVELTVLRAERPKAPNAIIRGGRSSGAPTSDIMAAGVLMLAGKSALAEKAFGATTAQQAHDLRTHSMLDICAAACVADGIEVPTGRMDLVRAAFSTYSLPTALGSAADKELIAAYNATPATWVSFATVKGPRNFRTQTGIRPSWTGAMEKVAKGGTLHNGGLDEDPYTYKIDTFGKIIQVTRQDVINDDLGFIQDTAGSYGRMAMRGVSDCVWGVVLANGGSFFASGNGNLLTGNTSPLSLASLAAAVTAMRTQRDKDGNDLDIVPTVLAVPPELETTARAILESVQIMAAAGDPMGNALKGIATLEVEPRMSNTTKFGANASALRWHLFASPAACPVIAAFLDGKQTPTVEFFGLSAEVDTLGVSWRVYMDYGAALGDHRAAVRSNGQ